MSKKTAQRYFLSSLFINNPIKQEVSNLLKDFYDIERIWRKFIIGSITPFEVANLYNSLQKIKSVYLLLESSDRTASEFNVDINIRESIDFIVSKIENSFIIETMSMFSMSNISKNFIFIISKR